MALALKLTPEEQVTFNLVKPDIDAAEAELRAGHAAAAVDLILKVVHRLPEGFSAKPEMWQNVVVACQQAVRQSVKKGSETAGDPWIRTALDVPDLPKNASPDLHRLRAEAFKSIGLQLLVHGRFDDSVACYRKAIAALPSAGYEINLTNALFRARKRAVLSDFTAAVTLEQLAPKLLVACVPKSGSSFLRIALSRLTGWKEVRAFAPADQFDQEFHVPSLVESARIPGVIQQHCLATEPNLQILEAFRIRPVVLVRNFADALLSLVEFFRGGAYQTTLFQRDFNRLSPEAQIDLLLEHRMPWYFEFVASWQEVERTKRLPVCWLSYEELIADEAGTLRRLIEYWKLQVPDEKARIEKALADAKADTERTRFNVGRAGRGKAALSPRQLERLASYARFFPSTDFTKVGLPPPAANAGVPSDSSSVGATSSPG